MHYGKPTEGAWPVMKNGLGNLAPGTTTQLAAAMRHQLDRIQRRPALITGFLRQTGLTLEPELPFLVPPQATEPGQRSLLRC
jgi:hypothetical protein